MWEVPPQAHLHCWNLKPAHARTQFLAALFYTACLLTRTSEDISQFWLCTLNIEADTPMKTYTAIKEKT